MALARTLYLFSPSEAGRDSLQRVVGEIKNGPILPQEEVHSFEELLGKLEGGQIELLLIDGRATGRRLVEALGEPDPDGLLTLSLAELEKRHILRVLASTGGNKTRAARVLGIDTKTLYNKLKSYQVSENARKRRMEAVQQGSAAQA